LSSGYNKEYLPIEGLDAFNKATAMLLLGQGHPAIKEVGWQGGWVGEGREGGEERGLVVVAGEEMGGRVCGFGRKVGLTRGAGGKRGGGMGHKSTLQLTASAGAYERADAWSGVSW
jgi:hypothetical protein